MGRKRQFVIPNAMHPSAGMEQVAGTDGRTYLLRNDVMFTAVKHSQGEFSEFFLALRDECRIFGNRCPNCRHIIVPPYMKLCSHCNFTAMEKEYVKDVGVMVASPVITVFAPSRFKAQVPFGTGRVYLETADGKLTDSAMMVRVRTITGAIRPGIYKKGTPVKVVFAKKRRGEMLDIFVLPQSELTPRQIAKSPLMESDVKWGRASAVDFGKPDPASEAVLAEVVSDLRRLAGKIAQSQRAAKDLAGWNRKVNVMTGGGNFGFEIRECRMEVSDKAFAKPDLVISIRNPITLLAWIRDALKKDQSNLQSPALTDLVLEGTLMLNKSELETITRLDRIPCLSAGKFNKPKRKKTVLMASGRFIVHATIIPWPCSPLFWAFCQVSPGWFSFYRKMSENRSRDSLSSMLFFPEPPLH